MIALFNSFLTVLIVFLIAGIALALGVWIRDIIQDK